MARRTRKAGHGRHTVHEQAERFPRKDENVLGDIGDAARAIDASLVSPSANEGEIKQYLWGIKTPLPHGRVGGNSVPRGGGEDLGST